MGEWYCRRKTEAQVGKEAVSVMKQMQVVADLHIKVQQRVLSNPPATDKQCSALWRTDYHAWHREEGVLDPHYWLSFCITNCSVGGIIKFMLGAGI